MCSVPNRESPLRAKRATPWSSSPSEVFADQGGFRICSQRGRQRVREHVGSLTLKRSGSIRRLAARSGNQGRDSPGFKPGHWPGRQSGTAILCQAGGAPGRQLFCRDRCTRRAWERRAIARGSVAQPLPLTALPREAEAVLPPGPTDCGQCSGSHRPARARRRCSRSSPLSNPGRPRW